MTEMDYSQRQGLGMIDKEEARLVQKKYIYNYHVNDYRHKFEEKGEKYGFGRKHVNKLIELAEEAGLDEEAEWYRSKSVKEIRQGFLDWIEDRKRQLKGLEERSKMYRANKEFENDYRWYIEDGFLPLECDVLAQERNLYDTWLEPYHITYEWLFDRIGKVLLKTYDFAYRELEGLKYRLGAFWYRW